MTIGLLQLVLIIAAAVIVSVLLAYYFGLLKWVPIVLGVYIGSLLGIALTFWLVARIAMWAVPGASSDFLLLGTTIIVAVILTKFEISVKT